MDGLGGLVAPQFGPGYRAGEFGFDQRTVSKQELTMYKHQREGGADGQVCVKTWHMESSCNALVKREELGSYQNLGRGIRGVCLLQLVAKNRHKQQRSQKTVLRTSVYLYLRDMAIHL